jgi:hypothetical protein
MVSDETQGHHAGCGNQPICCLSTACMFETGVYSISRLKVLLLLLLLISCLQVPTYESCVNFS